MKVQFLKDHRTEDGVMHRIGDVLDIPDKEVVEDLILRGIAKESAGAAPPAWTGGTKPDTGEAPPAQQKKK